MAILELPVRPDLENYTFTTTLDGASYTFDMVWSHRAQAWFMSITDGSSIPLLDGKKVTTGANLARNIAAEDVLKGKLIIVDTVGLGEAPNINDLGTRFLLIYEEV